MTSTERHNTELGERAVRSLLRVLPGDPSAFRAIILGFIEGGDADALQRLFTEAGYHGVSGVIDPLLASLPDLPAELRAQAAKRLAVEELWQAHLQRELQHAVQVLDAAGIHACALKGPALARRLYAPEFTRHCMDIDLLVDPETFPRASAALVAAGYVPEHGMSVDYLLKYSHHVGFSREGMPPLELHFRAYAGFGVVVPAALLLERARPYGVVGGAAVLIPSPEDEFIYLAAHAAGHSFCRLVWLFDLKLLLQRAGALDWEAVARRAGAAGVRSPVSYAIYLLRAWMGVDLDALPSSLLRRSARARFADRLVDEVSRPQQRSARENFWGLVFTSLLCDRPARTLWQVQHHMLRGARRRAFRYAPRLLPRHWNA